MDSSQHYLKNYREGDVNLPTARRLAEKNRAKGGSVGWDIASIHESPHGGRGAGPDGISPPWASVLCLPGCAGGSRPTTGRRIVDRLPARKAEWR